MEDMKKMKNNFNNRICLIPLILFVLVCNVSAESENNKETLYKQLTRAVVRLEEHQSICTPGLEWAYERNVPVGTAFFIVDKYNGTSKYFIVTARHVIDKNNRGKKRAGGKTYLFYQSSVYPMKKIHGTRRVPSLLAHYDSAADAVSPVTKYVTDNTIYL